MLSVRAMAETDAGMTALAVHGFTAPSQVARPVGGLAGASGEDGTLTPLLKPVAGLSDFLSEYIESRNRFEAELRTTLREARRAASSMEALEEARARGTARAEELRADAASRAQEEPVDTVENFAGRYNDLARFLEENRDVSGRAASLSSALREAARPTDAAASAGVTADEEGRLRVDAGRLGRSLEARPEAVGRALGREGLAGRAGRGLRLAAFNEGRLFPSVLSAMGRGEDSARSFYSRRAAASPGAFNARGSMVHLFS